jgi:hypothetical protein
MVNLNPFKKTIPVQREAVTAAHGLVRKEANKGQVTSSSNQWTDKQPHPANMANYPRWSSDPQVRIAIDLKTDMVAGAGYYVEMREDDKAETEAFPPAATSPQQQVQPDAPPQPEKPKVKPKHKNQKIIEEYLQRIGFRNKYKQIQRQKYEMGFCAVERLSDGSLKILPSDSIFIWRKPTGEIYQYTQEYGNTKVADWKGDDPNFLMFIHNEDPLHPYGRADTDCIGGLIQGMEQLNIDMPKIVHRYSAPKGIWQHARDITSIRDNVLASDVDEDIFIGNTTIDEFKVEFIEPATQVKFLDYIDQMNFQIGQALHAPLIMLLKDGTEASATTMLESVDRAIAGEQEQNADIIEQRLFKSICGDPVPEFMHGATEETMKDITLDQIGSLKGNSTITWLQAQDLIRKKGIDLVEDVQPAPPAILSVPKDENGKPLMNQDKINQADLSLKTVKAAYDDGKLLISEALKEGDRIIRIYVEKAKHQAQQQCRESTGKTLAAETEQHFDLIRQTLFSQYRNSLLPVDQ